MSQLNNKLAEFANFSLLRVSERLPPECEYEIFLYSQPKDLLLCAQVNNNFKDLCKLESLWRNISENDCNIIFVQNCWLFHKTWHDGSLWRDINNDGKIIPKKNVWYEACKLYYQIHRLNLAFGIPSGYIRLFSKDLSMPQCTLHILPPEIGVLTNLNYLSLVNNKLKQIPPEIGKLTNLQRLWLGQNELTFLPPEIGQLTKLESLGLNDNKLKILPKEIGKLTNLQFLGLSNNLLKEIPREICQLTNLRELFLYNNNQLNELPIEVTDLPRLQIWGPEEIRPMSNFLDNPVTNIMIYCIVVAGAFLFGYES